MDSSARLHSPAPANFNSRADWGGQVGVHVEQLHSNEGLIWGGVATVSNANSGGRRRTRFCQGGYDCIGS